MLPAFGEATQDHDVPHVFCPRSGFVGSFISARVTWNAQVTRRVIDACQDRNHEEIHDSV